MEAILEVRQRHDTFKEWIEEAPFRLIPGNTILRYAAYLDTARSAGGDVGILNFDRQIYGYCLLYDALDVGIMLT